MIWCDLQAFRFLWCRSEAESAADYVKRAGPDAVTDHVERPVRVLDETKRRNLCI